MLAMTSATTILSRLRRRREWLLAGLVCGSFAALACAKRCGCRGARVCTTLGRRQRRCSRKRCRNAADLVAAEPVAPADRIAASEKLVASNIAEFGRASLQTAEAYSGLADAHRQAKDYEKAAENYLEAVEVYRASKGRSLRSQSAR